jgi:hypothetical protein
MQEHAPSPTAASADRVEISVPLRTEYFATLRTLAAALGADAGFSVDEIEDLRLAISEVVTSLGDGAASPDTPDARSDARIDATFEIGDSRIGVTISMHPDGGNLELDDLASVILGSVVDGYEVRGAAIHLDKRAGERSEAPPST